MDTRIKDFSTAMVGNAISKLKQSKTDKAENAFFDLFDSAISANSSKQLHTNDGIERSVTGSKNQNEQDRMQSQNTLQTTDTASDIKEKVVVKEDNSVKISDGSDITEEELDSQLEQLMDMIAQMLMEKFGVTEEELMSALDTLGLTLLDMLEQPKLMDVAMELTGTENLAGILTDGNLYQQIQEAVGELADIETQFLDDTGLTAEELAALSENMKPEEAEVTEKSQQLQEILPEFTETESEETPQLELVVDRESQSSNDSMQENDNHTPMTGQEAFQQFTDRLSDYAGVTNSGNVTYASQMEMQEVMKQVVDMVKVQVQADTTSLEMQLHPESYGKLNLHVSVREGAVTAQLAVENEMVKSALEAQVVQLREAMDERGLKVDAVEVTIASHEFERNLEEGQSEQPQEEEHSKGQHRQINLQSESLTLEELMEMSESEALTRKIMLENGNSIDYSA